MAEDSVEGEVLYETRLHASGRYPSNYPPQPSKVNEDGKGFLASLLPVRGISQLKEKWGGQRNLTKVKKNISLYISPHGDRVAVAMANRITILWKENDYQEPYGIFTSNSLCTFTYGVWSESHDALVVADDTDTIYFVKANGEEIKRITKRQLKLPSPIIGLIPPYTSDSQQSSSFTILTEEGFLHHIDITQEPSASISLGLTSKGGVTVRRQFPEYVFCFDYDPELSLFVITGSAVGVSLTSSATANSGFCVLSLWRRGRNLDLESLFSIQIEGLYHKSKDYVGHLTNPKLLMSPCNKFVATLDITGCLYIFTLDTKNFSLSSYTGRGSSCSQGTNGSSNGNKQLLCDVIDFTWWSDHVVTLAKRDGVVTMLDILTGLKLQENDPIYSRPILDRVQELQGQIFLLECKSSEEENTEDKCNQFDFSRLHWTLISISQRSVSEMYNILISNHNYQAALDFASRHGMDKDEVLKSQWLHSSQGINEINILLSNIKDHSFVLSECVDKVGPTDDSAKALLAYGLHITDQFRFSESEDYECSEVWDYRMARLRILDYRDRLETYLGINMGRFSVQEYSKFRVVPLNEAAVPLAESGKIGALNLLFKRHPYSLCNSMLQILSAVPETVPVQTYGQLLPGRSPPTTVVLREEDWVECEEMVSFINKLPENHERIQLTEPIVKRRFGYLWPSTTELSMWYKNRARQIDSCSGQLDNCLCLVDFACRKGVLELQQFQEDISYLHQLIYLVETDGEICFNMNLVTWEQLSDYEKFRAMLNEVKEENVVKELHDMAVPFMKNRFYDMTSVTQGQVTDGYLSDQKDESFLVRWLKENASQNKLDICLMVIEEGCRELQHNGFFKNETEAIDCALQCIYLCKVTDRWSTMAAMLSKLPEKQDTEIWIEGLERRVKLAEGHVEAGRLLAFYQVPKPMSFFLEAYADEKSVKQILRLILSKFVRRQPGRSDNEWANMWRDVQFLREKAFPFLDPEYMLMEFCRGLLKAGKFSLARNYLRGTSSVSLASEKAENLVIQAAREYFFSASSLSCSEIWKAKECLSLFPRSGNVKAEDDIIDALTVKLPDLGVTLLPMQFRQIKDPMQIIRMAITSQPGAYLHVDELLEVAKLLGLNSPDDISAVEEAIAREAAVAGDLQLAFDLCLVLSKKGHGLIWDLCAAIARGPALENMDISSRKQLLGFALSHCDEESIGELLHAWKDLDMQGQCESLGMLTGTSSPDFSVQDSSSMSLPIHSIPNIEGATNDEREVLLSNIKNTMSFVVKNLPAENASNLESLLRENGKLLSFASFQLPWLLEVSRREENGRKLSSSFTPGKHYVSIQTQAVVTILSWLARNDFAPRDDVIASLAKSIMEPPVTEDEDIMGCSFLLNLVDAFSGVEVIEEQLRLRENYQEICSIMNVGMVYSLLHNLGVECKDPTQRKELLLRKFKEKHTSPSSDEINKIDEVQSSFWNDWKLKLEEKKRVAERSRILEQIIPGVETARFLSGDLNYIRGAVFSLVESVKSEKKHIMKDVLRLTDTYGLDRSEVLPQYLASILVSEIWADDEITAEISETKGEIIGYASETIKTISLVVYPIIDGRNKHRLAYIYGLLSDCYLRLEESKASLPVVLPYLSHSSALELAHLYNVFEQACQRVSFVKDLNFKNVAGLGGLNLQSFCSEIYAHVNESNLEALAKMVETLVGIYTDSMPEGLISWQDVYKHYVLSLMNTLESRIKTELFSIGNTEKFQQFISQLERTYDFCRTYIRLLVPLDALDIMKQYLTVIIPLYETLGSIPDDSMWQDGLIVLLNFWLRLTEEMLEISSSDSSVERRGCDPGYLFSCLKAFMRLVMEDSISPSQGWESIVAYVSYGLIGDFSVEILLFCRAMVFSGCGFGAISEVFSEVISHCVVSSSPTADSESQDLCHLYVHILEPILTDLVNGSHENQKLYNFLSSLSKLEGQIEDLQRVRHVVWEKMAQFSDNLQLPSHVRVYALELMQSITGRNIKGISSDLQCNVIPWEGWDDLLPTNKKSETTANHGLPDHTENSSRLTSTLVALKSSQIVSGIFPDTEITPDDLLNVENAVSCFLKLCEASSTDRHLDAALAILEEWEGFFVVSKDEVAETAETSEADNSWSNEDWDEGWESFQEIESLDKEKTENSLSVHPLHICWMEIFKKLVRFSQFDDVLRLIDQSLSKSNGILLDEDEMKSLSQIVLERDCFVALRLVLLLPYEAVWLRCLDVVEDKLKQGGTFDTAGRDHLLLILVLSSGVVSTIITKSSYGTTFSYLCYLVGNFSRSWQEAQLSKLTQRGKYESGEDEDFLFLFTRILLPCFIAELVKADQQILAGFIVTKFMHTNPSLSLINVAQASLNKYLEVQLHLLKHEEFALGETSSCKALKSTISKLRDKSRDLIESAQALLSTNNIR